MLRFNEDVFSGNGRRTLEDNLFCCLLSCMTCLPEKQVPLAGVCTCDISTEEEGNEEDEETESVAGNIRIPYFI